LDSVFLNFQTSNFTLQTSNKLPPEDNELLEEYDDIWFEPINRRDELIYSAAQMDGILLGYWVALVGQGVEKIKV
jgi:hypothetical protein